MLTVLFGVPLLCVLAWGWLAYERRWLTLELSLIMAAMTIAFGDWAIRQSRASTAGIGILFLPVFGGLSGLAAAAFGRWIGDARPLARAGAALALATSIGVAALMWKGGVDEIAKNRQRDREAAASREQARERSARVQTLVRANPDGEEDALAAELDAHPDDDRLLAAALETPFVSPDRIAALVDARREVVFQQIARNSRTRPDTLERLYRTCSYRPLYYQSLAANPHTPESLLRELAARKSENSLIAPSLIRNPSTPTDVRDALTGSTSR